MRERIIAIVGDACRIYPAVVRNLRNVRWLIVSHDAEQIQVVQKQLEREEDPAQVEFINCEKEGCWEADMIIIGDAPLVKPEFLEKISQVATQKVVLLYAPEQDPEREQAHLNRVKKYLPHSRVIPLVSGRVAGEKQDGKHSDELERFLESWLEN